MASKTVVVRMPSKCKECGSTSLSWFTQNTVKNGIQQNRLNTNDIDCIFVLGCDECSETLKLVSADKIADLMNEGDAPAESQVGATAPVSKALSDELAGMFSVGFLDDRMVSDIVGVVRSHTPTGEQESFQDRVKPWMLECFGLVIAADRQERNHRFLEEALELVQSCGATASEAHQLVDYVYGREVGEKAQEVGGVMVTLAALCLAQNLDMHDAAETELARIWTKVEKIRAKQLTKPAIGPLPGAYPDRSPAAAVAPTAWEHQMIREDGGSNKALTYDPQHPFGVAGVNYDAAYNVISDPLYRCTQGVDS